VFPFAELLDDLFGLDSFILEGTLILDFLWKARNSIVHDA
jgi:hypothetical protein